MTAAGTAPRIDRAAEPARPAPSRRGVRGGRHLEVVRPKKGRSPAVPVLVGVGIVLTALFALAVMHALMIGRQLQLDDMNRELAAETESVERLRLRVAELEAPERVLDVARDRLGMVEPADIGYVLPVEATSASEDPVRVSPATVPTTTTVPAEEKSAEQAEVDATEAGVEGAERAEDGAPADSATEAADAGGPGADP